MLRPPDNWNREDFPHPNPYVRQGARAWVMFLVPTMTVMSLAGLFAGGCLALMAWLEPRGLLSLILGLSAVVPGIPAALLGPLFLIDRAIAAERWRRGTVVPAVILGPPYGAPMSFFTKFMYAYASGTHKHSTTQKIGETSEKHNSMHVKYVHAGNIQERDVIAGKPWKSMRANDVVWVLIGRSGTPHAASVAGPPGMRVADVPEEVREWIQDAIGKPDIVKIGTGASSRIPLKKAAKYDKRPS